MGVHRLPRDQCPSGLCINRKLGESIFIDTSDGQIQICLLETSGTYARFVIACDKKIKIHREEEYRKPISQ